MDYSKLEDQFLEILSEELVPAKGCTEPIAIAFAGAKAREVLDKIPTEIIIEASANLIKNIRCVTVPKTNNLVGIEASALVGVVGGDSSLELEVISNLKAKHLKLVNELLLKDMVKVRLLDTTLKLHFRFIARTGDEEVIIEIKNLHTNIVKITKNNEVVFEKNNISEEYFGVETDRSNLNVENIMTFVENIDLIKVKPLLYQQIKANMAIATKGVEKSFGVSIGKTIFKHN